MVITTFASLFVPQHRIHTSFGKQFCMRANLCDFTSINSHYGISILHSTQSMCNYDNCFTFRCKLFCYLFDIFLGVRVKR